MSTIYDDLWNWFCSTLDADDDGADQCPHVIKVNPDRIAEFLTSNNLRITFDTQPAPDDQAFDGQYDEPRRALTARERDVLCRIIGDMYGEARRGNRFALGRTDWQEDGALLLGIRDAIDPRGGD